VCCVSLSFIQPHLCSVSPGVGDSLCRVVFKESKAVFVGGLVWVGEKMRGVECIMDSVPTEIIILQPLSI
jgi:hypothetical protein